MQTHTHAHRQIKQKVTARAVKIHQEQHTHFAEASLTGNDNLTASEILGRCLLMLGPIA